MNQQLIALLALISPAVFIATAIVSWFQPGIRPFLVKKLATASSIISILIAAFSGFFVINYGLIETQLLGIREIGLSIRLDALSTIMFMMIALISFIVLRFSMNYLDGDARQGTFIGRLAATIASVQLLVLSGNLGILFISWVLTSLCLHRLLVFYYERPGAIIAARKKFIVARLGDLSLLAASIILYVQYGTGNLEIIFQTIINNPVSTFPIEAVAALFAAAALLKSAQFPTHGWLVEVMETPTPVSALLHAGLLNAGPFLIIRMAHIMEVSSTAPMILIVIGGFTALFASLVFMTQPSIKTALGYSSVAHMGFSLLTCGLGVYPAAMLHLVSHSFYKAHAFLSSGSGIEVLRASKVKAAERIGSPLRIALGIILGIGLYTGFAIAWGIDPASEFSLLAIGGIIVLGLSRLFTSAIDSNGGPKLILRASSLSILVTLAFFLLESGSNLLLSSQLPELTQPSLVEMIMTGTILLLFGATVFLQIIAPALSSNSYYLAFSIHIRNGLYVNVLFDRIVRGLYSNPSKPNLIVKSKKRETISNAQVESSIPEVIKEF